MISAVRFAPEAPNRLLVSSWDKNLYLYEVDNGAGHQLQKYEHRAPVLDVCFGENDDIAYTAGLDWQVKKYVPSSAYQISTRAC